MNDRRIRQPSRLLELPSSTSVLLNEVGKLLISRHTLSSGTARKVVPFLGLLPFRTARSGF